MKRLGKFAKVRISSRNFSNSILNQARAFWAIAITSGICANSLSRFSTLSGSFTPPGTTQPG